MDEDQVEGGLSTPMMQAPGELSETDSEIARQYLRRNLDGTSRAQSNAALDDLSKSSEGARQALRDARARLIQYNQPNERAKYFDMAANFMAPTRSGRFGESLGRVAKGLADNERTNQGMDNARNTGMLAIDKELAGIDTTIGNSRIGLAARRESLESAEGRTALTALARRGGASSSNPADKLIISMIGNNVTGQSIAKYIASNPEIRDQLSPAFRGNFDSVIRAFAPQIFAMDGGMGAASRTDQGVGPPSPITTAASTAAGEATVAGTVAAAKTASELEIVRLYARPRVESALAIAKADIAETKKLAEEIKASGGLSNATGLMSYLPSFAGGQARDVEETIETLKIKTGLNAILQLKAAGGTVGQVTEMEGMWLQNSIASLKLEQSKPQFLRKVEEIITRASKMDVLFQKAFDADYGPKAPTAAVVPDIVRGGGAQAPAAAPVIDNIKTFATVQDPAKHEGRKAQGGTLKSDGKRWLTKAEWTAEKGSETW